MTIEEIILYCKKQYNNGELSEEERDNYLLVGRSLIESLAFKNMYKDDIVRFDQYYENIELTINDLENKENEGDEESKC